MYFIESVDVEISGRQKSNNESILRQRYGKFYLYTFLQNKNKIFHYLSSLKWREPDKRIVYIPLFYD